MNEDQIKESEYTYFRITIDPTQGLYCKVKVLAEKGMESWLKTFGKTKMNLRILNPHIPVE
jgi:hypothetical protein